MTTRNDRLTRWIWKFPDEFQNLQMHTVTLWDDGSLSCNCVKFMLSAGHCPHTRIVDMQLKCRQTAGIVAHDGGTIESGPERMFRLEE